MNDNSLNILSTNREKYRGNDLNGSILRAWKNRFRNLFRPGPSFSLEESVVELIEEHQSEGSDKISTEERKMLHNVLTFRDTKVSDIMIPRTDIIAVDQNTSLEDLKQKLLEEEHTRMPVYRDTLDNVVGFIHIKDIVPVLVNKTPFKMDEIIRQLLVISPSMKVIDLLAKMRHSRVHMALVVDEHGGTDGLVTIEDLVEEIVGEIQDEHDDSIEPDIILLDNVTIEASARLPIEKLEKQLNIKIADKDQEDFETLGGLILSMVGYVPVKGERIIHDAGIEFEILDSDPRKVNRLLIHNKIINDDSEIFP